MDLQKKKAELLAQMKLIEEMISEEHSTPAPLPPTAQAVASAPQIAKNIPPKGVKIETGDALMNKIMNTTSKDEKTGFDEVIL